MVVQRFVEEPDARLLSGPKRVSIAPRVRAALPVFGERHFPIDDLVWCFGNRCYEPRRSGSSVGILGGALSSPEIDQERKLLENADMPIVEVKSSRLDVTLKKY